MVREWVREGGGEERGASGSTARMTHRSHLREWMRKCRYVCVCVCVCVCTCVRTWNHIFAVARYAKLCLCVNLCLKGKQRVFRSLHPPLWVIHRILKCTKVIFLFDGTCTYSNTCPFNVESLSAHFIHTPIASNLHRASLQATLRDALTGHVAI